MNGRRLACLNLIVLLLLMYIMLILLSSFNLHSCVNGKALSRPSSSLIRHRRLPIIVMYLIGALDSSGRTHFLTHTFVFVCVCVLFMAWYAYIDVIR